jgi:hypothetical protein
MEELTCKLQIWPHPAYCRIENWQFGSSKNLVIVNDETVVRSIEGHEPGSLNSVLYMHANNSTCTIEIWNLENLGVANHVTVERSTLSTLN